MAGQAVWWRLCALHPSTRPSLPVASILPGASSPHGSCCYNYLSTHLAFWSANSCYLGVHIRAPWALLFPKYIRQGPTRSGSGAPLGNSSPGPFCCAALARNRSRGRVGEGGQGPCRSPCHSILSLSLCLAHTRWTHDKGRDKPRCESGATSACRPPRLA